MKDWWNRLSLRDKRVLSVGLFIIAVIMLYNLIWDSLLTKNQLLRQQVQENKKLIIWMRAAEKEIQNIERKPFSQMISHSSLSVLQPELQQSNFGTQIYELKQTENGAVELHFQAINFDKLMEWLIKIYQKEGFVVSQMEVKPTDKLGLVNGQMLLERAV